MLLLSLRASSQNLSSLKGVNDKKMAHFDDGLFTTFLTRQVIVSLPQEGFNNKIQGLMKCDVSQ